MNRIGSPSGNGSRNVGLAKIDRREANQSEISVQVGMPSAGHQELLASVSKGLRRPLDNVLLLAKLLADNSAQNLSPKQVDYAQTIYATATEILTLLDDVIELANIASGDTEIKLEPERLIDICQYLVKAFSHDILGRRTEFDIKLAPGLPAEIQTDGKWLRQILRNHLSAEMEYSRRVTLSISPMGGSGDLRQSGPDSGQGWIEFAVIGSGSPHREAVQRKIFDTDGSVSRDPDESGVGLTVGREWIRLLGGKVEFSREDGGERRLALCLPLPSKGPVTGDVDAQPRMTSSVAQMSSPNVSGKTLGRDHIPRSSTPPQHYHGAKTRGRWDGSAAIVGRKKSLAMSDRLAIADSVTTALSGMKVLIIDDDIRNVYAMTAVLEAYGITMLHAESGLTGLDTLHHDADVGVVLVNTNISGGGAQELIREIRRIESCATLPIVALTNKADPGQQADWEVRGASDQIDHPVNSEQLLLVLHALLVEFA